MPIAGSGSRTPALDLCLRKTLLKGPARATLVALVPITLVVCAAMGLVAGWKMGVFLAIFGIPMAVLSALAVLLFHTWPMTRRMRALVAKPDGVVWVYTHVRRGTRSGTHDFVTVGRADGRIGELQTTFLDDDEWEALLAELRTLAPWATHGFSPEAAALFRQSPAALRKGP